MSDVDARAAWNDRPVRRHEPPERDVGTHPGRGPGEGVRGAGGWELDVLQRERDQGSEDGGARNYQDQVSLCHVFMDAMCAHAFLCVSCVKRVLDVYLVCIIMCFSIQFSTQFSLFPTSSIFRTITIVITSILIM